MHRGVVGHCDRLFGYVIVSLTVDRDSVLHVRIVAVVVVCVVRVYL